MKKTIIHSEFLVIGVLIGIFTIFIGHWCMGGTILNIGVALIVGGGASLIGLLMPRLLRKEGRG